MKRLLQRLMLLAIAMAALGAALLFAVRPWYLNWGSTSYERTQMLPGDEIVGEAASQQTRAITIDAPADAVWPWLAQTGQDRGGFFSFDLLENIVGCEMPTRDVLQPEKQTWHLGDKLWMYPSHKAGGAGFATLRAYQPGRAMAFGTRMIGTPLEQPENGSWTFVLEPVDARSTRLLIRGRGEARHALLGHAFDRGIFEPIHFFMERRMMIGLKELAETGARDRLGNNIHIALWAIALVLCLAAAASVLIRPNWRRPLVAFLVAAVVFQILTLGQPPLWIGVLLLAGTAAVLGRPVDKSEVGKAEVGSKLEVRGQTLS